MAEPVDPAADPETAPHPAEERVDSFLKRMTVSPRDKLLRQTEGMGPGRCCTEDGRPILSPGVVWEGIFHGWAGYAKANREIVHRIANTLHVQTVHSIGEPAWEDLAAKNRIRPLDDLRISLKAPLVRLLGPDSHRNGERYRISWTMMESDRVHPNMVRDLNLHFDELWTPTHWNLETFRESGVEIPGRVMPLGINPLVFRPLPAKPLPPLPLLSTSHVGHKEQPKGFIFLSLSLPSFRKGFDVLAAAFEDAFGDRDDVSLVIATTFFSPNVPDLLALKSMKSRIYALTGSYTEHQMAAMYSSCNAYVTASRGEGWNLPVCEAAACGLPVICPEATSHPEVVGGDALMFHAEGSTLYHGSESVHEWYKDMPFTNFGKKSHDELVDHLRTVHAGGEAVQARAAALRQRVTSLWTWDNAATQVARRLLELQP